MSAAKYKVKLKKNLETYKQNFKKQTKLIRVRFLMAA